MEKVFTNEFKYLICRILASDPRERLSLKEIKFHPYMKGPVASQQEVFEYMCRRHNSIPQNENSMEEEPENNHFLN